MEASKCLWNLLFLSGITALALAKDLEMNDTEPLLDIEEGKDGMLKYQDVWFSSYGPICHWKKGFCGEDYYLDLPYPSLEGCEEACSHNFHCQGVTYTKGKSKGCRLILDQLKSQSCLKCERLDSPCGLKVKKLSGSCKASQKGNCGWIASDSKIENKNNFGVVDECTTFKDKYGYGGSNGINGNNGYGGSNGYGGYGGSNAYKYDYEDIHDYESKYDYYEPDNVHADFKHAQAFKFENDLDYTVLLKITTCTSYKGGFNTSLAAWVSQTHEHECVPLKKDGEDVCNVDLGGQCSKLKGGSCRSGIKFYVQPHMEVFITQSPEYFGYNNKVPIKVTQKIVYDYGEKHKGYDYGEKHESGDNYEWEIQEGYYPPHAYAGDKYKWESDHHGHDYDKYRSDTHWDEYTPETATVGENMN